MPAVITVFALIAWPMYLIVSISFREGKSLNFAALGQRPFGLGNYASVLTDSATWHSAWVSLAYTFGTITPAFAARERRNATRHASPARRHWSGIRLLNSACRSRITSIVGRSLVMSLIPASLKIFAYSL